MPAPENTRLTIEFDLQADPIVGVVHADGGRGEPFAGWMALTRVIERTLDAARGARQDIPDAPRTVIGDDELPRKDTPR